MRDPVLDRNMFRSPKNSDEPQGIAAVPKEESDYERRKRQAAELLAAAKERQNPDNYRTLSEQSRPGVFRPVATGQPQAPQPNTQQQMAQMQAMGFRPVGMADGGYVKHFREGGLNTSGTPVTIARPSSEPMVFDPLTGFPITPPDQLEEVFLTSENYPSRRSNPASLPYAAPPPATPASRGIVAEIPAQVPQEPQEPEQKPRDKDTGGGEKPDLTLDDIKARRSENIALAMIQAGLAMAGGQSSNPLTNIAAGGISGLQAYGQAEKERRAELSEERKYREEQAARIQRASELRQEKDLTREARVYDTAQSNLAAIDREISRLQMEIGKAMGDETQIAPIRTRIQELLDDRRKVGGVVNRSLRNLGYEGEDIFSAAPTPVAPAIDFSKLPK